MDRSICMPSCHRSVLPDPSRCCCRSGLTRLEHLRCTLSFVQVTTPCLARKTPMKNETRPSSMPSSMARTSQPVSAVQSAGDRENFCSGSKRSGDMALCLGLAAGALMFCSNTPEAAAALLREEPSNALSFPTWVIHVSSVAEWVTAMGLMWQYAEVTGDERWKGMTWGMIPLLGGALAACTWHFFYNSPELDWLVALQAGLTVAGNFTAWLAAYRLYAASQPEGQPQEEK